jgi:hypothetical protein
MENEKSENEKSSSAKTEVREMPDTVRTAGSDTVRDTDMGTVIEKPKKVDGIKKTIITGGKKIPDTVRTAGEDNIMSTDK